MLMENILSKFPKWDMISWFSMIFKIAFNELLVCKQFPIYKLQTLNCRFIGKQKIRIKYSRI